MPSAAQVHFRRTARLAKALKPKTVYDWLSADGFFPEQYVLPPCFKVVAFPRFGKEYFKPKSAKFKPKLAEFLQVPFPKTDLTDRTFAIVDPEIHSDIAYTLAKNWTAILGVLFSDRNKVCSYSFPIPLDARRPGKIGRLRSGRMIYEFIAMAENDLAAMAYRYEFLARTDIKNFYPSIYTHSIAWALHGKTKIRTGGNRSNYAFFGNRIDKLFQNSNDGCTNGIPIGPAVSDLIAELVLAAVDASVSKELVEDVFVARFKDDYRILAKTEGQAHTVVKSLQAALKEYKLELNEEKTEVHKLPDGLFRTWVSQYHAANPYPKNYYSFKRFKEVYLAVVRIDRDNRGTGVIDRFLADLVTPKYKLRLKLRSKSLPKAISLLLMLGRLRTKAFPKVMAILEAILRSPHGSGYATDIEEHLGEFLKQLVDRESENKYLISWLIYFLRANDLRISLPGRSQPSDPIARAVYTSRFSSFKLCHDFRLFQGVRTISKQKSMLEHLSVFHPQ
jgi:Reverse transcriptase (RNA-dependent DNA polymerase)